MDRFWKELSFSAEANPVHVVDGAGSRDEQLRRRAFVVMSVWSIYCEATHHCAHRALQFEGPAGFPNNQIDPRHRAQHQETHFNISRSGFNTCIYNIHKNIEYVYI